MLQKLDILKEEANTLVEQNLTAELFFDANTKRIILEEFKKLFPESSAVLQDGIIKITNSKNQSAYLPFNWFSRIRHCKNLINALIEYGNYSDILKRNLDDAVMKELPKIDWESNLSLESNTIISTFMDENFADDEDKERFSEFLDGRAWLDEKSEGLSGKKLNRTSEDYISSCITTICKLINDTAGKLDNFIKLYISSDLVKNLIDSCNVLTSTVSSGANGFNVIYYGAPGTGKSNKIDELAPEENSIRTVFHSETQYSDFVGCLKPCMNGSDISYQFRPGPFTLALVKAVSDTEAHFYLIIEEINRAAAAAVFGDIFQLLDRRYDGRSQYAIDVVDMDFKHYLENNCPSLLVRGRLILPSNLSLLATMNSSDQAVMPMDSAFKRRWQFEYVSIESDTYPRGNFNLNAGADTLTVSWENLSKAINNQLAGVQIPEDRLLGPWFVNENELQNSQATLAGKLAMYLWEDVLRHAHRESIFNTDKYPTLYQLIKGINANEMVFSDSIIIELRKLVEPLTPAEA